MGSWRIFVLTLLLIPLSWGKVLDIFGDPQRACRLLERDGLAPGKWTVVRPGFQCVSQAGTPENQGPHAKPGVLRITEGEIAYVASGSYPDGVTRLKLIVQLKLKGDNRQLMADYGRLAATLVKRIGLQMPAELEEAIQKRRQYRKAMEGANVTFDPGRKPYTLLTLIVRDPRVRVVPIPRVQVER